MELELEGRTAIVTGASRGIGLACVRALAAAGAEVVAGARRGSDELAELAESTSVRAVEVDLAQADGPERLAAAAGGPVHILVNNVGSAPARPGGFAGITDQQWADTLTLNLLAAVRMTRAVLPGMVERGSGAIVNIGSVNAELPDPLVLDYSVAKAALHAFAKGLSKEIGPKGVRVNTVSPGPVATDLWLGENGIADSVGRATGAAPGQVREGAAAASATGRFSRPEEIADLVLLLASDATANVTGSFFRIDGGLVPTW
ncbi:SDR family oxidoreductase [Actinospica durhamensis]|uniref:SDR family oxidoreductase n=1 Tax=Actinospica durhamensis TaxID=1508375 RepID=A0A941IT43_9ACTN|nr:oxidoreductase [Actinospica durhamensis]MBR7835588.1 SDR family oxidoreductase [Actinospica durhamensis]